MVNPGYYLCFCCNAHVGSDILTLIVAIEDLKPEPTLWHEDSGRKPWENRRQDPPGNISGRQLGDAAHRLVANSLQVRARPNGYSDQMHRTPHPPIATYGSHSSPYQNNRYQDQERNNMRSSNVATVRNHFDHGYSQPYASAAVHDPYSRSHHERDHYDRSYSRNGSNHQSTTQSREHNPNRGYHPPGFQQHGGNRYPAHAPPRHGVQTPIPGGAHFPQQGGYNSYQSYGAATYHDPSAGWAPQVENGAGRGYGRPQQLGNQFSALSRGSSRQPPPPPGYRR
ncbi:hypothetical protein RHMOL_Rhmol07G0311400 [Rhododendron molle]|uniref:Uncharacterized protein n=1 Tax=Rhododendron molle TaxID=49168 RepID=A0ACC0N859_RHOML|nr:hypothetical protein RHMOL_Rhmol07G0311400 [Rhododendron molle]